MLGCAKFYGLVFFRVVFWDFRRSSLSCLPQSTPPPGFCIRILLGTSLSVLIIILYLYNIIDHHCPCMDTLKTNVQSTYSQSNK